MPVSKTAKPSQFTLDATKPVADGIFDIAAFEKYLNERVKVEGRTQNLANAVVISREGAVVKVVVAPNTQFAKRYIKYLAKRFLKKHQLRDWLRVVASSPTTYELRYFNIDNEGADDDE